MSPGEHYASIPERITWSSGFQLPVDQTVLGKLSTFANFKTGRRADMRLAKLIARCAPLSRSTVLRALHRLEADGWVTACRRHRRPTSYDICLDRLATHWREVKVLTRTTSNFDASALGVTGDTQESLRVTDDTQEPGLSVTGDTQEPVLSVTGDTPSPVRTDPLKKDDPLARGLSETLPLPLGLTDQTPGAPSRYDATADIAAIKARLGTLPAFEPRQRRRRSG